jgi:hypothetical protein
MNIEDVHVLCLRLTHHFVHVDISVCVLYMSGSVDERASGTGEAQPPRGGGGGGGAPKPAGGDCGEAGETPTPFPHCVHETHLRSYLLPGMPPDLSPLSFFSVRVFVWLRDYSCFGGFLFFESPGG